jgi:hypothetical protein
VEGPSDDAGDSKADDEGKAVPPEQSPDPATESVKVDEGVPPVSEGSSEEIKEVWWFRTHILKSTNGWNCLFYFKYLLLILTSLIGRYRARISSGGYFRGSERGMSQYYRCRTKRSRHADN